MDIEQGRKFLSRQGLNMFAVLTYDLLPQAFISAVRQASIPLDDRPSLILIGHGGNDMWRRLNARPTRGANRVDEFSVLHARRFVRRFADDCRCEILYPGPTPIPLQQLGAAVGWHYPSPLGLGVNRTYGPWFGYRVVLLMRAELPALVEKNGDSPCGRCTEKPCLTACPANALSATGAPDVSACVDYRLQDRSTCQALCHARLACPAGEKFRYDSDQLNYFYRHSLDSIRAYMNKQGS